MAFCCAGWRSLLNIVRVRNLSHSARVGVSCTLHEILKLIFIVIVLVVIRWGSDYNLLNKDTCMMIEELHKNICYFVHPQVIDLFQVSFDLLQMKCIYVHVVPNIVMCLLKLNVMKTRTVAEIWTGILRLHQSDGRSLLSQTVQNEKSFLRNGRTRHHSKDCA